MRKARLWLLLLPAILAGAALVAPAPLYAETAPARSSLAGPPQDPTYDFLSKVLGATEDAWSAMFRDRKLTALAPSRVAPEAYAPPFLILFDEVARSACGTMQTSNPAYCQLDRKLFVDPTFYVELEQRYSAPGDGAQVFVIFHEVAHHVQDLLGVFDAYGRTAETSVPIELQADCLAGVALTVWNRQRTAAGQTGLEPGDVDEILTAAFNLGDPYGWNHGTPVQRQRWTRRGLESGDPAVCDTFTGPL